MKRIILVLAILAMGATLLYAAGGATATLSASRNGNQVTVRNTGSAWVSDSGYWCTAETWAGIDESSSNEAQAMGYASVGGCSHQESHSSSVLVWVESISYSMNYSYGDYDDQYI
jgi:hypothetical protein